MENEDKTELDQALEVIPDDLHTDVLKLAHKYRVDETDPTWILLRLAVEAQDAKVWAGGAAKAAGDAADRVRDEIRGLPEKIKTGAETGAEAAKKTVEDAGIGAAKEIRDAGISVGQALVGAIRKEGDDFGEKIDKVAGKKKKEVVDEFKRDFDRTIQTAIKVSYSKGVILIVLMFTALFALSGAIGWSVKSIRDDACVGSDRHFWTNDGVTYCMVQIKK